jgi:hypothetical protein
METFTITRTEAAATEPSAATTPATATASTFRLLLEERQADQCGS